MCITYSVKKLCMPELPPAWRCRATRPESLTVARAQPTCSAEQVEFSRTLLVQDSWECSLAVRLGHVGTLERPCGAQRWISQA